MTFFTELKAGKHRKTVNFFTKIMIEYQNSRIVLLKIKGHQA